MADIARASREACDDLYASYQALVKTLDETCRPLLAQGASTRAVKEVLELIRWLNSESEISSNFSGSFNGAALGDLVSVQYVPTMENKMTEKYWQSRYASMPGTAEEDRAYTQRQAEASRKKREEELEQQRRVWEYERREREEKRRAEEEQERRRLARVAASAADTQKRREELRTARQMIGASMHCIAVVRADGTVAAGSNLFIKQEEVAGFRDIKAVVCANDGVVGLNSRGGCETTATRSNEANIMEARSWSRITDLAAGARHVVGLREDGTCAATSVKGSANKGQSNVQGWRDICQIACGRYFTLGLKTDGTVVYAGDDCAKGVRDWKDVAMIAAGSEGAVGMTREGRFLTAGKVSIKGMRTAENVVQMTVARGVAFALQSDGKLMGGVNRDVWDKDKPVVTGTDVVAVAGGDGLLMLKKNGTLEVSDTLSFMATPPKDRIFTNYDKFRQEKQQAEERQRQQEQRRSQYREQGVCQYCGGAFKKTLFGRKCSQCGKSKDY